MYFPNRHHIIVFLICATIVGMIIYFAGDTWQATVDYIRSSK